jgi:transcriptional regulator GlxA family with amidase domain
MHRVTIAAWFLKNTALSVSEIYPRVGFDDHSIFCRTFKYHFGVAPEKYRDNHQAFEKKEFHPTIADNEQ